MAFIIVGLCATEEEHAELKYMAMVASTGMRWRGGNE